MNTHYTPREPTRTTPPLHGETSHAREELADWLRDAHAMEMQAEAMLKGQAARLENYPQLKARIEQHITETQRQARDVEQCLKSMGEDTSALKDTGGKAMAMTAKSGMRLDSLASEGSSCAHGAHQVAHRFMRT